MQRLQAGFTLGDRYVLRKQVGVGGMGEVWAANDTLLARTVALKIMHPWSDDEQLYAKRFREEAMHTAGLSHLNIATLFDYGEDAGLAYLVMELVRGVTLQQLLELEGAQPPARVRSVVGQAALALSVAHEAGIVHRDVKPANIMVTKDGTVKLTDFGIARSADSSGLTKHGEMLGTPHYVSPEQALGEVATPLSDLYALGIVAHELLSGRRPFDKGTPIATALAQVQEPPPPLPLGVPDDLRTVIESCLAKDPTERPGSARVVAEALGAADPENGWPDEVTAPKRAAALPDRPVVTDPTDSVSAVPVEAASPQRGIDLATAPMELPADWVDPDPTPAPARAASADEAGAPTGATDPIAGPTTVEIEQGAFPAAAEVRDRLDDEPDAAAAEAESIRWWMPGAVVADQPADVNADPWPEASTPVPGKPVDERSAAPVADPAPATAEATAETRALGPAVELHDPASSGQLSPRGSIPLGWVIVLIVVALALGALLARFL